MITTARVARWLQSLPDDDATTVLDTVTSVAANPDASSRHCKKLGAGLWEARIQRPHRTNYRVMFSFRPDGQLVLLSGCMKKSTSDHERAIRTARAALMTDDIPQESAMSRELPIFSVIAGWVYAGRRQYKIVHATRKKIVIATDTGSVELNRARLERDGQDIVNGVSFRTSRYALPIDMDMEQTA